MTARVSDVLLAVLNAQPSPAKRRGQVPLPQHGAQSGRGPRERGHRLAHGAGGRRSSGRGSTTAYRSDLFQDTLGFSDGVLYMLSETSGFYIFTSPELCKEIYGGRLGSFALGYTSRETVPARWSWAAP